MAKLGEVTIVRDCLICDSTVILMANRDTKQELPEKNTVVNLICDKCRKQYLDEGKGVMVVNEATLAMTVIKEEAFVSIFTVPDLGNRVFMMPNSLYNQVFGAAVEAYHKENQNEHS